MLEALGRLVRDGLVSVQDAAASAGVDADEIRRTLAQGSARTAPAPREGPHLILLPGRFAVMASRHLVVASVRSDDPRREFVFHVVG